MNYEVLTIGGVRLPTSNARPVGVLGDVRVDVAKLASKEVVMGAGLGLLVGVVIGVLIARH